MNRYFDAVLLLRRLFIAIILVAAPLTDSDQITVLQTVQILFLMQKGRLRIFREEHSMISDGEWDLAESILWMTEGCFLVILLGKTSQNQPFSHKSDFEKHTRKIDFDFSRVDFSE